MQPFAQTLERARQHWRHAHGCYRWDGSGRCVDCQTYSGTPTDAVAYVDGEDVLFYAADRRPAAPSEPVVVPVPRQMESAGRKRRRPLTADQIATREAWRQWREAQGDEHPNRPRSARRSSAVDGR